MTESRRERGYAGAVLTQFKTLLFIPSLNIFFYHLIPLRPFLAYIPCTALLTKKEKRERPKRAKQHKDLHTEAQRETETACEGKRVRERKTSVF